MAIGGAVNFEEPIIRHCDQRDRLGQLAYARSMYPAYSASAWMRIREQLQKITRESRLQQERPTKKQGRPVQSSLQMLFGGLAIMVTE